MGTSYWFVVDGVGPLLDPDAMDVVMTAGGPRSGVRSRWPRHPPLASRHADPVVYELHVRGFATHLSRLHRAARPTSPTWGST